MAVDYLKTYLGIDPNDYSSMEARIRGEEPQARTPVMMRQPMMMPQQRSLGDIEAMQLIPRQQPAPQPAPQVDDRYQGLMDQIAALRSQIDALQAPSCWKKHQLWHQHQRVFINLLFKEYQSTNTSTSSELIASHYQAPPEIENSGRANQNQYPKHQQKTFKQALIIWLAYQK
jgi:hypothetical protein